MINNIIEDRLKQYQPKNKQEELLAIKEICQEIVLMSLSRAGFFKKAAFQGGTCLRIIHHLPRFSEDLDFILFNKDTSFSWKNFMHEINSEFSAFGLHVNFNERLQSICNSKKSFY